MQPGNRLIGVFAALVFTGCAPPPEPPPDAKSRALERAIHEPLDKANAVEDQVKAARDKQEREMRENGG